MSTITTSVRLDAELLKTLPSHDLAELAMTSVKLIAERFTSEDNFFHAKEMLAILTQLQQRARPGFESTIPSLTSTDRAFIEKLDRTFRPRGQSAD